ncbi:unnamed protein product [Dicrocoelium dendriticum]|nr:unnamed protein product [Dicrocoelium dendriticum]
MSGFLPVIVVLLAASIFKMLPEQQQAQVMEKAEMFRQRVHRFLQHDEIGVKLTESAAAVKGLTDASELNQQISQ